MLDTNTCEDYLKTVRDFADKIGARQSLEENLEYLANYGGTPDFTTCFLYHDWAPQSFAFVIKKDDSVWINGGLIYHGPQLDGSTPDPLSIEINPVSKPHWSIHT